jgi:hypothetical protein
LLVLFHSLMQIASNNQELYDFFIFNADAT